MNQVCFLLRTACRSFPEENQGKAMFSSREFAVSVFLSIAKFSEVIIFCNPKHIFYGKTAANGQRQKEVEKPWKQKRKV